MHQLEVIARFVEIKQSIARLADDMKKDINTDDQLVDAPELKRKIVSSLIAIGALTAVLNGIEGTEKMMRMADMYEEADAKGKSGKSGLT